MKSNKPITITGLVILLLFVYYSMSVAPLISDEEYTYIGGLNWYNTFEEGQRVAFEQDKPMLVYFWATWCEFCEKMQTEVYPDPSVNEILKDDFVLVAIDIDNNKEDANRFSVSYPPKEVFTTPDGVVITSIGGAVPAESFLPVLKNVVTFYQEEYNSSVGG